MTGLERLYLIADMDWANAQSRDLVALVRRFVSAGGRMVSLRGGACDDRQIMAVGAELSAIIYAVQGLFLVHRRCDLARLLGADGVHLPSRSIRPSQARRLLGDSAYVGRSCHSGDQVRRAHAQGASFVTLGPLFESLSKPGYGPAMDFEQFSAIAASVACPVYALGGVTPPNLDQCLHAGAAGVGVVGGIVGADDVAEATRSYLTTLEEY